MPDLNASAGESAPAGAEGSSRRAVLRGAAGAGAAGIVATALGGLAFPAAAAAAPAAPRQRAKQAGQAEPDGGPAEPVVVHVRDAAAGEIDVFRGTTHTRLHDRELAARLVRASR